MTELTQYISNDVVNTKSNLKKTQDASCINGSSTNTLYNSPDVANLPSSNIFLELHHPQNIHHHLNPLVEQPIIDENIISMEQQYSKNHSTGYTYVKEEDKKNILEVYAMTQSEKNSPLLLIDIDKEKINPTTNFSQQHCQHTSKKNKKSQHAGIANNEHYTTMSDNDTNQENLSSLLDNDNNTTHVNYDVNTQSSESISELSQDHSKKFKTRSRSKNRSKSGKNTSTANQLPPVILEDQKVEQPTPPINKKMLISVIPGEQVEVALCSEGQLLEYFIEMTHHAKIRGNIYKGIINNIDANLQAAFINYGNVKNGFLQIDEVHPEYYLQPHEPTKGKKYPPIQKVLKAGQEILVQVVKEPTGNKGAFLTTWLSLAGRFLVLTPGQEQIGISRKVEDEEERTRLRELIKGLEPGSGLGAIVRTVSIGTNKTTLQKDLSFLKRVWKEIRKKATTEKSPCLIYQEPGLATRAVRDYLADDITEIWVDDPETTKSIQETTTLLFPRKTKLVHLYQNHNELLWEHFKLNKQIMEVHSREVIMPSGGRLVFDQTEALMAIDINSGRIGGKTNFESMAYRTNMEAASTIAKQLRLRDVGGQIVIDFIEMKEPTHCRDVEKELQTAMKADRARHDVGKMSSFGLLQVVRQRTGSSAISITQETCPCCQGTGQRRNIEWQSIQTLREIHKKMQQTAASGKHEYIHILDQELGLYLLNHKRERLLALEQEFGIHLDIYISTLREQSNKEL